MAMCGGGGELTPSLHRSVHRDTCAHSLPAFHPATVSSGLGVGWQRKALGWNKSCG